MALVPLLLVQGFASVFAAPARSSEQAADQMAGVYARYARGATAGALPWVPTGAEQQRLRAALAAATVPMGTPQMLAQAWASGLAAFWLAPPVPFPPGVASAFPGQPALVGALSSLFSNPRNQVTTAAAGLGSALDAATRTILVQVPVVGPVPLV